MDKHEISIIIPCLNEEKGIGACLDNVKEIVQMHNLNAEVIVVDNGSKDKSQEIAIRRGAKVLVEPKKGYGRACIYGLNAAKGTFIIMADSDGSYDFSEIPRFLDELKKGNDFVIGNRFNNKMEDHAMPLLHKYIANPILRTLLHLKGFRHKEVCTGFIGIRKQALEKMDLKSSGMEFSTEFLINVARMGLKTSEIDITYKRRIGKSKMRTFRDGWRHFRYIALNNSHNL